MFSWYFSGLYEYILFYFFFSDVIDEVEYEVRVCLYLVLVLVFFECKDNKFLFLISKIKRLNVSSVIYIVY